jgi:hypothetical protein
MERVTAICIFDDIIEFGGAVAAQYIPSFLPFVFQHCAHTDVEIRQACLYGVGVMAQVHSARVCAHAAGWRGRAISLQMHSGIFSIVTYSFSVKHKKSFRVEYQQRIHYFVVKKTVVIASLST